VREFIDADEKELGALILVDVVFVAAVAKARGGPVVPGHQMLGLVVVFVGPARDVAAKLCEQRSFKLRIGATQEQSIGAVRLERLHDGFVE